MDAVGPAYTFHPKKSDVSAEPRTPGNSSCPHLIAAGSQVGGRPADDVRPEVTMIRVVPNGSRNVRLDSMALRGRPTHKDDPK
jgi:hypothetical protein